MSCRRAPGAPSMAGFGLEMQKIWPMTVPKKKVAKHFFIYVQAMEILSMYILTLTHVTNPPYH